MIRPLLTMICLFTIVVQVDVVQAQWQQFAPFKRKQRAPDNSIEVNQQHGPWLIMCASFAGEEGFQQAQALVQELRNKYGLRAYIHARHFDYSTTFTGVGWEVYETPRGEKDHRRPRMKALHSQPFNEYAVLVGDFPSLNDARAQKTLERIKHLKPETLHVAANVETNQRMGLWREIQRRISNNPDLREKGPMRAAFIMPNPKLPQEYFADQGMDPLVEKMNRNNRYSLLKCPEPYSVRVATFRGETTFKTNEMQTAKKELQQRKRYNQPVTDSKLAEAAEKANLLCRELRKHGIEAYEFHDRNESFVCVGSYPWAVRKMPNGKDKMNPEIAKVIKKFKARVDMISGMQGAVRPKSIPSLAGKGIFFDVQPLPVKIPQVKKRGMLSRR